MKLFLYEPSKSLCFYLKFIKSLLQWLNKIFLRNSASIYQSIFLGVVASKCSTKWTFIIYKQTKS